jgi:hypothetical protein
MRRAAKQAGAAALGMLLAAAPALAWGPNAVRLATGNAVETLPPEMAGFFKAHRKALLAHSTDSLDWLAKDPAERPNHLLQLDHYGRYPFDSLPRDYNEALRKYGRRTVEAHGVLPWQIGLYSEQLTIAFRGHNWDQAQQLAAVLAGYVAEAHDPFNSTEAFQGYKVGQPGVDERFRFSLVDRYLRFLFIRPPDATFIKDPTGYAFDMCLGAHSQLEQILLADRLAHRGLAGYSDEYYDRFYARAGSVLLRELTDAATDIGSYWYTAWVNAGRPALPGQP